MQSYKATVVSERQLVLDDNIDQPVGGRVIVNIIPADLESNYSKRLKSYYEANAEVVKEEEKNLSNMLGVADAPLEPEEPWW